MNNNDDKHLDFVLRHYRKDTLDTNKALRSVKERGGSQQRRPLLWRWVGIAASLLCLAAFATALTIFVWDRPKVNDTARPASSAEVNMQPSSATVSVPKTFHFDNTPLREVLDELSAYYGVRLSADQEGKRLTGDFEADSLDMTIRLIEEVLDVTISRKDTHARP